MSWKDPKALWQEPHNKGIFKTKGITKTVKTAVKYNLDILESALALVPVFLFMQQTEFNKPRPVDNLQFHMSFQKLIYDKSRQIDVKVDVGVVN